ncbi:MAG: tRNA uridine-5-carboxymethylaminomethyl(34) synthesis GTPase MnmE [Flavobacteriaceae bacterium]
MISQGTIVAIATPSGAGALGIIRLSGPEARQILAPYFKAKSGKKLLDLSPKETAFGTLHQEDGRLLDEVLLCCFNAPNSFTGENVVELSCHGSSYILQEVVQLCLRNGAVPAQAGEFTLRAFLNKKMDLSQAEAVADLIASDSKAAHTVALQQMRGGYSKEIQELRQELLNFASLLALELDFSEEDVEFADRKELLELLEQLLKKIDSLVASFSYGSVLKTGIPVAIAGKPNAGKSSLLNAFLNEDKAIVSDIAGTTRDSIEDTLVIDGVRFRFIDTAGIRDTEDSIEAMGVARALAQVKKAQLLLYVFDCSTATPTEVISAIKAIDRQDLKVLAIGNKTDLVTEEQLSSFDTIKSNYPLHFISTPDTSTIQALQQVLVTDVKHTTTGTDIVVTNARHYSALIIAASAIKTTRNSLTEGVSEDLVSVDLQVAINALGEVTGAFSTDELLGNIFANFCIGK